MDENNEPMNQVQPDFSQPTTTPQPSTGSHFVRDFFATGIAGFFLLVFLFTVLANTLDSQSTLSGVIYNGFLLLSFPLPASVVMFFRWKRSHVFSWGALSALLCGILLMALEYYAISHLTF